MSSEGTWEIKEQNVYVNLDTLDRPLDSNRFMNVKVVFAFEVQYKMFRWDK